LSLDVLVFLLVKPVFLTGSLLESLEFCFLAIFLRFDVSFLFCSISSSSYSSCSLSCSSRITAITISLSFKK
jgi:hypothetical protein